MPQDRIVFCLGLILILTGCTQPALTPTALPTAGAVTATDTRVPGTAIPDIAIETPVTPQICSPLSDFSLPELKNIISNPFAPAMLEDARDGGHHGVDFAYYTYPDTDKAMLGAPIQAVLSGRIVSVSAGRPPYGNLILIETPLSDLPEAVRALFSIYPRATPSIAETHLTCPHMDASQVKWDYSRASLYTLYAHMQLPAEHQIEDEVACGEVIGRVGTSGSSVNPHLHLEMRFGPGGASFTSLAHYSGDASAEEMAAYCTWRVSGVFQLIDPMLVIATSD
jgi:murein DD-endopeptidase MepM/ murein hydrolase activator NlpD